MKNKIIIPKWIQFKIYLSLVITTILFISVYVLLFLIGNWILAVIGLIPLIYAISVKSKERGFEAKEKDFPELFKVVREVAQEFNMNVPSKILILPTEQIYVTGVFKKKIGVGIAGLRTISKDEFKAILRHEFGHLYGKDTIIGMGLSKIQISLESSSKFGKSWWNAIPLMELAIVGLFIAGFAKAYSFIFRVIISIYSRQVEYRADYVASKLAGEETFGSALLNYSAYTNYFGLVGYNSIINSLQQRRAFINIYETVCRAYEKEDSKNIKKITFENDKGSIFSSHPQLRSRLKKLGLNLDSMKIDNKLKHGAISLVNKQKQVEEEFTQIITNNLHINLLYADAVAREGKCRYCKKQFEKLQELLEHEEKCENKKQRTLPPKNPQPKSL